MPTRHQKERPALEIRIAGEGISPNDVSITELARLLSAAAGLLRTLSEERKIPAPEVALAEVRAGSAVFKLMASDQESDEPFSTLAESAYAAAKKRGQGESPAMRAALDRLYAACSRGPIEVGGRTLTEELKPILMGQPLKTTAKLLDTSTVLFVRITSVSVTKGGFEVAAKRIDGGGRVLLFTDKEPLAERAARLFNRTARVRARFARSLQGDREGWTLVRIGSWDPKNLVDVMADIGEALRSEGFLVDAERYLETERADRAAEDT